MVAEKVRPQLIPEKQLKSGHYSLLEWQAHSQAERAPYASRWKAFEELSDMQATIATKAFNGYKPLQPWDLRVFRGPVSKTDFLSIDETPHIPENVLGAKTRLDESHDIMLRFMQSGVQYVNPEANVGIGYGPHEVYVFAVRLFLLRPGAQGLSEDAKRTFGQEDDYGEIRMGDPFNSDQVAYDLRNSKTLLLLAERLLEERRVTLVYENR